MTQATTAFADSYFSVFVSLISLVVFLTAGSDPELLVIDFDCNSSSTRLTASRRSWSVSSWQRDSCSWWRNALKRSRSFISAYPHNQIDFDCLLILHSAASFCTRKVWSQAWGSNQSGPKFDDMIGSRTWSFERRRNWKPCDMSCNWFVVCRLMLNHLSQTI